MVTVDCDPSSVEAKGRKGRGGQGGGGGGAGGEKITGLTQLASPFLR